MTDHHPPPRRGTCKECGAPILWIRMAESGKPHPVDAGAEARERLKPDPEGPLVVVTEDGRVVKGRPWFKTSDSVVGRISHFATCSAYEAKRRAEREARARKKEEEARAKASRQRSLFGED